MMMLTLTTIDQYLDWLTSRSASAETVRAYRSDLVDLANSMLDVTPTTWEMLETLTSHHLNELRHTSAPTTTKRKIASYRAWAKWAGNPTFLSDYLPPTPAKPEPHPLPEGIPGVLSMIAAASGRCAPQRRALVALCGLCGLRVGESVLLTPDRIDVDQMELKVTGKGDKTRPVPMSDQAWRAIGPAYNIAKLAQTTVIKMGNRQARVVITELGRQAGLSRPVSSHDLRATFATSAYNATKDLRVVQELLGHASPDQTQTYVGVTRESRRAAVEAL